MEYTIKSPIISLNVFDLKLNKDAKNKVKGRPFHSLSYRKEGVVKFDVGNEKFISQSDCITFIPKGKSYSTEIIEDTRFIVVHFNIYKENVFNSPFLFRDNNQQLKQLFNLVLKKYSVENINNLEAYSYFYKILAEIEYIFEKSNISKINPAVSEAKLKIEKNFTNNNFNIDSLVDSLNISASHLRSEFKKNYSMTPIEYLKYVRIQNAISLLASGYYSIEEIAIKSGYNSTSYFIQSFRNHTSYSD